MTDKINYTNNIQVTITTTISSVSLHSVNSRQFIFGISLALLSSLFIGSSFILKKKGLLNLINSNGSIRAGSGGFGYLYEIQWWAGLATMGLGELCNFAAYGFAPASVVTPLGALSVLVSALMAVRFLGEKLDTLGKIGCILTLFGSIVIIIHSPKESEINSLLDFARKVSAIEFIFFSFMTCVAISCLIIYYGPRLGSKYVHIYVLICSLLGTFTVTACKGLGVGLKEFFIHEYSYSIWLTVACAIIIIVCILIQMVYLNRALDIFATPIVTTVYYVLFTTCVLITSSILFHEWRLLTFVDVIGCFVGFSITTCGLILINFVKTNAPSNEIQSKDRIDNSLFSDLLSDSQLSLTESSGSTSIVSVKQQHYAPVKTYANLLSNESNISFTTNNINEQCQPFLLIDECNFNF
ncbi:unnamed protein product [Rotaria magnacalcarata]|uniref:Magnesium transporter NIPA2 n=1 Tax=Rotaria magnacalcarata TaxID=392030 RepID=A0A818YWU6_9BILA|nr:unnamed protein product [Rotaria magnacalcarata]CAF1388410.1 unnamed protein product [Rotaria magnacalcarata]CAF2103473.1 unnamed protein product [Rotaria magnacalcarata]CAF2241084.1 unnamed protein product [Rotaria magnacalcarata]CAF3761282.1 unnamed protein product [Rotaria magnacalcarata]